MNEIECLRIVRECIGKDVVSFVQVGANDGIDNDIANTVLGIEDAGYFIEPVSIAFGELTKNKSNYVNSVLLQCAIVPECMRGVSMINRITEDEFGQGSSFAYINADRMFGQEAVVSMTPGEFLQKYNISDLDFLFCDAEGLDHLIVLDFLKYINPLVIFFETDSWLSVHTRLDISDGSTVVVPSISTVVSELNKRDYFIVYPDSEFMGVNVLAIKKHICADSKFLL